MAEVIWSDRSKKDLRLIRNYIAEDSEYYADAFIRKLIKCSEILISQPEIGKLVPEYKNKYTRQLIYKNYRLIYEYANKRVEILAVLHAKRELRRL